LLRGRILLEFCCGDKHHLFRIVFFWILSDIASVIPRTFWSGNQSQSFEGIFSNSSSGHVNR